MSSILTVDDLCDLALGASVLGAGGGGDTNYELLIAQSQMRQHGPVTLLSAHELAPYQLVVPLACVGAPLVGRERLIASRQLHALLDCVQTYSGTRELVLMPGEIGGSNALVPFLIASQRGLPVLDGDLVGRAFPEMTMNSAHLAGRRPGVTIVVDSLGATHQFDCGDAVELEQLLRGRIRAMGSCAAVAVYCMPGREAPDAIISGSVSRSLTIGRALRAIHEDGCRISGFLNALPEARLLARGTVINVQQRVFAGFGLGIVDLDTSAGNVQILFKNEYLVARSVQGQVLGASPDLLVVVDTNSGAPIASESLRYGVDVALLCLKAPEIWYSETGYALVNPSALGIFPDWSQANLVPPQSEQKLALSKEALDARTTT